ncbi:MAG: DUF357 domain-containing protein [Candidatus Aenigmarchaeota archaeon]|nr:DUF357 domain-containing protein [Candidatus Aenigmarchaeota archaeon]
METDLERETAKQLEKLEDEVSHIEAPSDKKVKNEIINIKAYISDCRHFLENGDLMRAFEAIVFAWGIYETLLSLGAVAGK